MFGIKLAGPVKFSVLFSMKFFAFAKVITYEERPLRFQSKMMMVSSAPSDTTLPNHKQMDLLKKVINMNLPFFNKKNFILTKVFEF